MTMFPLFSLSKWSGKIPIRILVIIPFILQIITMAGLASYFILFSEQKTLQILVNQLQQETKVDVQQYLKMLFAAPFSMAKLSIDAVERGELSLQDTSSWHNHLFEQIQLAKLLNYPINELYVANEKKQFIMIKRLDDGSLREMVTDKDGNLHEYALNQRGTIINRINIILDWKNFPSYPLQPGWTGHFSPTQGNISQLSKIFSYPYFTSHQGYSPTALSLNKKPQGFFGIGISFETLNHFLSTLEVSRSGTVFIIDRSGSLIATSSDSMLKSFYQKNQVVNSQEALIQATIQHLSQHVHHFNEFDTEHRGDFVFSKQHYFFQVSLFRGGFDLEWLIVGVVPEENFTEYLQSPLHFTLLFSFVVFSLAVGLVMLISHWLVQPLLFLNQAAKHLTRRKWQAVNDLKGTCNKCSFFTPIELIELYRSFEHMTQQLQKAFLTLQTHEEKYRSLFDSANDAVLLIKDDKIIDCNTQALSMFGFETKDKVVGQTCIVFSDLIQNSDQLSKSLMQEKLQESMKGKFLNFEWTYKKDNTIFFDREVTLRRVELEECFCVQAVIRDVTERKIFDIERRKFVQQIKEREEYWRTVVETVLVGISITRFSDGRFIYVNDQVGRILGLSPEQIIDRPATNFYRNPSERKKMIKLLFREGYLKNYPLQIKKTDDSVVWVNISMRFLILNHEKLILTVFYDVTEHKQIEAEKSFLVKELEEMNMTFSQLNAAYERFIPHEFLSYLNKENVLEVNLGDQIERNMTVLFSDIRNFTAISEKLTPVENFEFINLFLGQMEPLIREHRGFIDKYIGDAIMALFPSADQAVKGSIDMLHQLKKYNRLLQEAGLQPIAIGIGLNTGRLMLGTVGSPHRMEGTVISDAVNLASRIEGLTKIYHSPLLITEYTYQQLHHASDYRIRIIDRVLVKGKTKEVTIYEVFDADSFWIRKLKLKTLFQFEQGVDCFHREQFDKAKIHFENVLNLNEGDLVARKYFSECQKILECNELSTGIPFT